MHLYIPVYIFVVVVTFFHHTIGHIDMSTIPIYIPFCFALIASLINVTISLYFKSFLGTFFYLKTKMLNKNIFR